MRPLMFILCFMAFSAHADDMNQNIPDTPFETPTDYNELLKKKDDDGTSFLPEVQDRKVDFSKEYPAEEMRKAYLEQSEDHSKKALNAEETFKSKNQDLPEHPGKPNKYLEYDNYETVREQADKGKTFFSFTYDMDSYTYKSNNNVFEPTFRRKSGGKQSDFHAMIRMSNVHFISRVGFDFGLGGSFGAGYNGGNGIFPAKPGVPSSVSEASFKLWTIPLDFVVAVETNVTRFIKLAVHGGPSLLGVIQTRSDLLPTDKRKAFRALGKGYFLSGLVKLSLTDLIQYSGFKHLSNYEISKYYLHFEARTHNYGGFKDKDVKVQGISYGIGLTYEYL